MAAGWFYSPSQIVRYFSTRLSSLSPPKVGQPTTRDLRQRVDVMKQSKLRNPVAILRELTTHQWLMFAAGFLGWTWDSFDFFTVSMTITEISEAFDVSYSDVSWVRVSTSLRP